MLSVLALGLLLGLQHALDVDHLAAVASLSSRGRGLRDAARQGAAWGVGHAVTLLLVGGSVLLIGNTVGPQIALLLEATVGLMLIILGGDVLLQFRRRRVHFHVHSHGDGRHVHAHSHRPGEDHGRDPHQHRHEHRPPLRALIVGMVHGMAGSAALIVLALGSAQSIWHGMAYIALFGFGSIVGMTALATIIALPLSWSARGLTWAHNGLTAAFGLFTVTLGALLLAESTSALVRALPVA
jgi:ABC-type nickel/cobalt efflux system permease component RcnA